MNEPPDKLLRDIGRKCAAQQVMLLLRDEHGQHVTTWARTDEALEEMNAIADMFLRLLARLEGGLSGDAAALGRVNGNPLKGRFDEGDGVGKSGIDPAAGRM